MKLISYGTLIQAEFVYELSCIQALFFCINKTQVENSICTSLFTIRTHITSYKN